MATDLTSARWVLELSRETLVRDVGVVTLSRAEGYAASDQVRTLAAGRRGQLVATVNGSGRGLYQTVVEPDRGTADTGWFGRCSCPVAVDCKHAVAVMLVAARRLRELGADTSRQDWEHALAAVVRAPSPGAGGPHGDGEQEPTHRLGLELGLPDGPDAWDQRARVVVRPVRRSLRGGGRWARSGVTWRDLSSPWASPGVDPVHRAAVSQLHTAAQSLSYRHFSATELSLGDMGALAWPVLQRCRDVGVELVAGTGLTAVELGRGTVDVVLDLARAEDGHLSLAPRLVHDDGPVDDEGRDGRDGHDGAGRLLVLGRPAHGVVRVDREGRLQLWPVRTSIPEPLVPLVERDTPVQVPVEDVERFRTLYYPHLARAVPVRSGDGSAEDLEPARPVLLLDLTPGPEHALDLAWSFLYRGRDTSTSGGPEDPEAGTAGAWSSPSGARTRMAPATSGPRTASSPRSGSCWRRCLPSSTRGSSPLGPSRARSPVATPRSSSAWSCRRCRTTTRCSCGCTGSCRDTPRPRTPRWSPSAPARSAATTTDPRTGSTCT
ncbi:SWIM zinc finger family protein [Ornithinimicrobium sp. W1665]|uniref:SWIM zinc finger family protein n=1 Tax=Ornithinimicrobium sp. W1665 TaxID=3416666 RepID=UPI003D6BFEFF